jgi:type IV pilus assembly protein PilQ
MFRTNRKERRMECHRVRWAVVAALAGVLSAPVARAEDGEPVRNRITALKIERDAAQTVLKIEGSRAPVFSVYTLQEPLRLVVDVSQGDVSRLETPIDVDDGVLTKIVAAQYGEGPRAVGRVILGFLRRVPYDIRAEGTALVVRLAAVGKERPTAAMMAAKEEALRDRERRIREKDAELSQVKEALDARSREVEAAKSSAADAEKRARDAAQARDAEVARRESLEKKVTEIQGTLEGERSVVRKAEEELTSLRKELEGAKGAQVALERARADAAQARAAAEALRRQAAGAAEEVARARAQAGSDERAKEQARDAELRARQEESRRLAERLNSAERRLQELEALRARVEAGKDGAEALLRHKVGEVEVLRTKLEAAERLARATAGELEKARDAERKRTEAAALAKRAAATHAEKAAQARTAAGAAAAGEAGARVALAEPAQRKTERAVVVRDVGFQNSDGRSRVLLTVEGEPRYVVHKNGERRLVLDLPGAHLPEHLRRRLDVSEFNGPVSMVSAYESTSPVRATRLVVDLRGPATYEVTRSQKGLELQVVRPHPRDPDRVVKARPVLAAGPAAEKSDEETVLEERAPPPQARARPKQKRAVYRGRRINLDLQDAEIHTVLKLISEVIRLNFVVSDDVKGRVTMTLRDVPWDQALEIILKSKGMGYLREGNIIRVAPEKVLQKEAEDEAKKQVVIKESQPILLKIIPVNYAKASDLLPRVKDVLSDKGAVSVDARTNRLIVRDIQRRIRAAERMVKKLDTQTPQILIEARIVEANTTFSRDIGIQWGGDITLSSATGNPTGLVFPSSVGLAGGAPIGLAPATGLLFANPAAPNFAVNLPAATGAGQGGAVGITLGSIGGTVNLSLRLSAAEENGQAKIISAPKITTLDNQKATIQQGVSIPISQSSALGVNTIFVDANLTLTVTPHVTLDGSVILDISATKNEPDFQRTGAQGDPTILRKEARTQVLIKDGETTVIGGIYTRNVTTNYREVPLFSKIPILGWLFKKKLETDNRTELLIFITPRIVNRPEAIGT